MFYKVGDTVIIKSIDWYNKNKKADFVSDEKVHILVKNIEMIYFTKDMSEYCGKEATITEICNNNTNYKLNIDSGFYDWVDEMFEDSVDKNLEVGKTFIYGDKKLKVVGVDPCEGCFFKGKGCPNEKLPYCESEYRNDENHVIFKEVIE